MQDDRADAMFTWSLYRLTPWGEFCCIIEQSVCFFFSVMTSLLSIGYIPSSSAFCSIVCYKSWGLGNSPAVPPHTEQFKCINSLSSLAIIWVSGLTSEFYTPAESKQKTKPIKNNKTSECKAVIKNILLNKDNIGSLKNLKVVIPWNKGHSNGKNDNKKSYFRKRAIFKSWINLT